MGELVRVRRDDVSGVSLADSVRSSIFGFRREMFAFLDRNRVKRIKGGPFEAEFFDSISKAKEALKESSADVRTKTGMIDGEASGEVEADDQSSRYHLSVYQDDILLTHRPEYAVLESWKELEGVLQLAASVSTRSKARYRPIRKVIFELISKGVISETLGEALFELNDARNAIVHAEEFRITRSQAKEYIATVEAALQALQDFSEGN